MTEQMLEFLEDMDLNAPATAGEISVAETSLGITLPIDYKSFLRNGNGGDGFVGDAYAILWKCTELKELNVAYEVEDNSPGLLIFGSNGGGEAFGFDTRRESWPIVSVPFVGMRWQDAIECGVGFPAFLAWLKEGRYDA